MMSTLRVVIYTLMFFILQSAGIRFTDWRYWAFIVLLIVQVLTFALDDKR